MQTHVHEVFVRAIESGAAAGLAPTAVAPAGAMHKGHRPYAAMNTLTHFSGATHRGEGSRAQSTFASARRFIWAVRSSGGVLFEALCERRYRRSGAMNVANASATTALVAYVVDYQVVPKRVTPGFESHLPKGGSLGLTYVALGAGFALAAVPQPPA